MSYAPSYSNCNYVRKCTNRWTTHLQQGYVGKPKPVPTLQSVSVGKTSTTQTMPYKMFSRLQKSLQDFYGGDSGLEHQTPYSMPQLLQGLLPQEATTAYICPCPLTTSQTMESDLISQVASFNSGNAYQRGCCKHTPATHGIVG